MRRALGRGQETQSNELKGAKGRGGPVSGTKRKLESDFTQHLSPL